MRNERIVGIVAALALTGVVACGDGDATRFEAPSTTNPSPALVTSEPLADAPPECPADGCDLQESLRVPYADDATGIEVVDVFWPSQPGPWPVVVLVHGIRGSRASVTPWAREVATQGAVALAASYPDRPPFVEAIEHIGCTIRFARSIASDHGGDPDDVTLVGHSLGAAMGAVVALDDEVTMDRCLATDGSTSPEALVGYEGPYDIAFTDYDTVDITSLESEDPAVWRSVNPYTNVGQQQELVVRLVHGLDDDKRWYDVLPSVSEDFHRALLDAGYDVELVMIDGATHGSINPMHDAFDVTVAEILEAAHS